MLTTLLTIVLVLALAGLLVWAVLKIPMPEYFRTIIQVVAVIIAIVWVLDVLDLVDLRGGEAVVIDRD